MKSNIKMDILGKSFGYLTVVAFSHMKSYGISCWKCRCRCGVTLTATRLSLVTKHRTSCGCARGIYHRTHGLSKAAVYNAWHTMLQRCYNSKHPAFHNWGGRGITVCERWKKFEGFFADMGKPQPGMSLERIDNGGNYEPGNCRWATQKEQTCNTRRNRLVYFSEPNQNSFGLGRRSKP